MRRLVTTVRVGFCYVPHSLVTAQDAIETCIRLALTFNAVRLQDFHEALILEEQLDISDGIGFE